MRNAPIPTVTATEAAARLAAAQAPTAEPPHPLLVDVRERDEFAMLRVAGAVLLPLSGFAAVFQDLPRDRPLLMFCAAGSRSARATEFLLAQGFADVSNVAGGITAWRVAGLPTRSGAVAPGEGALPNAG
jgi:rhodanese-related sulfurtransferase